LNLTCIIQKCKVPWLGDTLAPEEQLEGAEPEGAYGQKCKVPGAPEQVEPEPEPDAAYMMEVQCTWPMASIQGFQISKPGILFLQSI